MTKRVDKVMAMQMYFAPAITIMIFSFFRTEMWMQILVGVYVILLFCFYKDVNKYPKILKIVIWMQVPVIAIAYCAGFISGVSPWFLIWPLVAVYACLFFVAVFSVDSDS